MMRHVEYHRCGGISVWMCGSAHSQCSESTISYRKLINDCYFMVIHCVPNRAVAKVLLAGGLRPDFRFVDEPRQLVVEYPPAWNAATVRLGETVVTCTVSCDLVRPNENTPKLGMIRCNVAESANPPNFSVPRSATATIDTSTISQSISSLLKGPAGVPLDSLCVKAGIAVWSLRVDVMILNDDGNVHDASVAATAAALRVARRCEVVTRGNTAYVDRTRPPVELAGALLALPLSVTLSVDAAASCAVVDPSSSDQADTRTTTTVTIVAYDNADGLQGASTAGVGAEGRRPEASKGTTATAPAHDDDDITILRFEKQSGPPMAADAVGPLATAAASVAKGWRRSIQTAAAAHVITMRKAKRETFAPKLL